MKRFIYVIVFIIILLGLLILFEFYKESESDSVNNESVENIIVEDLIKEPSYTTELTIVGDFLYEEPYYESLRKGDSNDLYFSRVKKYFSSDDLSIGNMEVVITDGTMELSGVGYSFCAPQFVGDQIIDLDMEVMSISNNHSNDRGLNGRLSTYNYFKDNSDILPVGIYNEERDVSKNIVEKNGIRFGFLSYTYGTNEVISSDLRKMFGLYKDPDSGLITDEYLELMKSDILNLRDSVDCLIVIMHWGYEFTFQYNYEQEFLADYFNKLGVDIIIGNHSHSIQPIKWIRGEHDTLVYYSLGNFVSADHIVDRTGETFTNAYQFGLLSKLNVSLVDNKLSISNVRTKPIINYYDVNLRNYILIPLDEYSSDYEISHYLYNNNFNINYIRNTYYSVIDEEFRKEI